MLFLRTLLFTILAPGAVTVGIPALLLLSGAELLSYEAGAIAILGTLPMAAGVAIYLWCASDFVLAGRGTPAPSDAPKSLVSRGLYRMVRNPMYVGIELILVGEAVVFESVTLWVYSLLVWLGFHSFVVLYEEPNLRRRFGTSYEEYRAGVPRWLPRLAPRPERT